MGMLNANKEATCECGCRVFAKEEHVILDTSKYTTNMEQSLGMFYRCIKCNKTYNLSQIKMLAGK